MKTFSDGLLAAGLSAVMVWTVAAPAHAEQCPQDDIKRVIHDLGMQGDQAAPDRLPRKISLWKLRRGIKELDGTHMIHWRKDAAWDFPTTPQWAFSYYEGRKARKLVITAAGDHLDCLEAIATELFGDLDGAENGTLRNRMAKVQMQLKLDADLSGKDLTLSDQVSSIALSGVSGDTLIELAVFHDLTDAGGNPVKRGETLLAVEISK